MTDFLQNVKNALDVVEDAYESMLYRFERDRKKIIEATYKIERAVNIVAEKELRP